MAAVINAEIRVGGSGSISDSATAMSQAAAFGGGILQRLSNGYSAGTGNFQVNKWYLARRALAATTFDNINLTSGLSALGTTQAFTALKAVLVQIIDPDGTKKLRVGPQGQTNANLLWFQAVTTNFWEETYTYILKERPVTGWSVAAASTDIFSIYNPGATSITYALWLLGTG